ncbi:hypothetical protein NKDENANG_02452 [Candidatus Entotheonellaceae bacterium PAL068K]
MLNEYWPLVLFLFVATVVVWCVCRASTSSLVKGVLVIALCIVTVIGVGVWVTWDNSLSRSIARTDCFIRTLDATDSASRASRECGMRYPETYRECMQSGRPWWWCEIRFP